MSLPEYPIHITYNADECCENLEHNMMPTGIELPDGRDLFEMDNQLYYQVAENEFYRYEPIELPWHEKIDRIRQVVNDCQYQMIEGVVVDAFSAQAIVAVFDHLTQLRNKLKFLSLPIPIMADIAFKLLK